MEHRIVRSVGPRSEVGTSWVVTWGGGCELEVGRPPPSLPLPPPVLLPGPPPITDTPHLTTEVLTDIQSRCVTGNCHTLPASQASLRLSSPNNPYSPLRTPYQLWNPIIFPTHLGDRHLFSFPLCLSPTLLHTLIHSFPPHHCCCYRCLASTLLPPACPAR